MTAVTQNSANLILAAGTGITLTTVSNETTIALTASTTIVLPAGSYTLQSNRRYLFTGNSALTLPTSASQGDVFSVTGGQASWSLGQAAGQQVVFAGGAATTSGTSGSISTNSGKDWVTFVFMCNVANLQWVVYSGDLSYISFV